MVKWADFGISAVRFNSERTHIDKIQIRRDNGDVFDSPSEQTRQDIIRAIKNEHTFVTILKNPAGKWCKGQPVYIFKVNGTEYIKTVENDKEMDNLDNLPEF